LPLISDFVAQSLAPIEFVTNHSSSCSFNKVTSYTGQECGEFIVYRVVELFLATDPGKKAGSHFIEKKNCDSIPTVDRGKLIHVTDPGSWGCTHKKLS
jgi:hypothetical protein